MNESSTQEPTTKYYGSRESIGVWGAGAVFIAVIGGGSSLAAHSWQLTSCLLLGILGVWYIGYWALSKSCYFISATGAGFKDVFRAREIRFDEVRSVTKIIGRNSMTLVFECATRTVRMPFDPMDETWFSALKTELLKRGITVSSMGFGFKFKDE